jgi:hypothetical protein
MDSIFVVSTSGIVGNGAVESSVVVGDVGGTGEVDGTAGWAIGGGSVGPVTLTVTAIPPITIIEAVSATTQPATGARRCGAPPARRVATSSMVTGSEASSKANRIASPTGSCSIVGSQLDPKPAQGALDLGLDGRGRDLHQAGRFTMGEAEPVDEDDSHPLTPG